MDILKLPFSKSSRELNLGDTRGCEDAPERLHGLYSEQRARKVAFIASGGVIPDLSFKNVPNLAHANDWISDLLIKNQYAPRAGFVGGDHSVTYNTFKEFSNLWGENKALLISLDAHPDLTKKSKGNPYNSDWLRFLIDGRYVSPDRVLGFGWRDIEDAELAYAKDKNIKWFKVEDAPTFEAFHLPQIRIHPKLFKTYLTT